MTGMQVVDASPAHARSVASRGATLTGVAVTVATIVAILALAVLPLLSGWFMHPALDAAGSATWLGVPPATAHALSDRTVAEMLQGPATFAFPGPDLRPFYDASEAAHLRDARVLLLGLLVAGGVAGAILVARLIGAPDRRATWSAIGRGGAAVAVGVALIGIVAAAAFGPLFELFHRVFFPGGNWAFDPRTQHLVQLYPVAFWQIAAGALGAVAFVLGLGGWLLARRMSRR
jgi:hypothetical protein